MMNPYTNNYFNYQPQFQQQNPYMDRLAQLQQFQQNLQQPIPQNGTTGTNMLMTLGKFVESMEMVKATDIPMDGNVYYFPKADGTEIYSKQWMQDGRTRILTFKPILDNGTTNLTIEEEKLKYETFNDVLMGIQEDIKTLTEKVDKINKPVRSKKEVAEDE